MNDYQNYLNMLKSHAGNVQDKEIADKMETAYLVHEAVIKFFAGVEKQFNGLMQGTNTNMNVIEAFLTTFEQYSKDLAGLKFQISRIKNGVLEQSSELQELVQYCREEMTFQEVGYCLNELCNVYQAEQQRLEKEELERQKEKRNRQEELKQQKELELKRRWQKRRKEPMMFHDKSAFNLYERRRKPEYASQGYVDNRDGTVTDMDTGLMWERSGAEKKMNYGEAQKYIDELSRERFAGHSDWRLPTVDELLSLVEPGKKSNGLYIHLIFDGKQKWCWSSDSASGDAWGIGFDSGGVYSYNLGYYNHVRAVHF
ncbi:MAG: DUF1566 domain-containing protein [Desulfobacteraceae bacterium]|nr:DUF1566 domain-containing protein [Desulfobacteraceae bacterium]